MKILMAADTVGGVWTYALELAGGVRDFGVEVILATMGPRPTATQRAAAEAVGNVSLVTSEYRLEWMQDPWADVDAAGDWLLALEQRCAPDIIHLNGYAHVALPFVSPTVLVAHSCVFSWWRAVHGTIPPAAWTEYRRRVSRGLQRAGLVITPSRSMLDALGADYGFEGVARVIPNGRSASRFRPARKRAFVMAAGRMWDEAKNLGSLAGVARRISWPVCIAGPDTAPDGNRFSATTVVLLGMLDEDAMARTLAQSAVFAHPALYEPFGLVVVEAGLSGCALVLSDIPSLRENWDGAAVFVPCRDDAALGDAIERLTMRPSERTALSHQAYERARMLTPERMARAYMAEYERLALSPTTGIACAS